MRVVDWISLSRTQNKNLISRFLSRSFPSSSKMASGSEESGTTWSFGFGSNMDPAYMKSVKGLDALDSTPAILKGHRLCFSLLAFPYFEPSFASLRREEGENVHGVAIKLSLEDADALARMEGVYVRKETEFEAYDGRILNGFFFDSRPGAPTEEAPCSKRYLDILISGAKKAGLDEAYIRKLENLPYYIPPPEILEKRKTLPDWKDLPEFTVADLAAKADPSGGETILTGSLGYVVERFQTRRLPPFGRDLTSWSMCRLNGVETKTHDGGGRPPFPCIDAMREDELEYARRLLDHLLWGNPFSQSRIVGVLKEFKEQQSKPVEDAFKILADAV